MSSWLLLSLLLPFIMSSLPLPWTSHLSDKTKTQATGLSSSHCSMSSWLLLGLLYFDWGGSKRKVRIRRGRWRNEGLTRGYIKIGYINIYSGIHPIEYTSLLRGSESLYVHFSVFHVLFFSFLVRWPVTICNVCEPAGPQIVLYVTFWGL